MNSVKNQRMGFGKGQNKMTMLARVKGIHHSRKPIRKHEDRRPKTTWLHSITERIEMTLEVALRPTGKELSRQGLTLLGSVLFPLEKNRVAIKLRSTFTHGWKLVCSFRGGG